MGTLHRILRQEVMKLPRKYITQLIEKKLSDQQLQIPEAAKEALIDHILKGDGSIDFSWKKEGAEEAHHNIVLSFTDKDSVDLKNFLDRGMKDLSSELITIATNKFADEMFATLKKDWDDKEGSWQRKDNEGFKNRLEERWSEGLDLLRMLLKASLEFRQDAEARFQRSKSKKTQHKRFVLCRLHVRACQVMGEIITLMENGYADGAMARWRTLHEISVVATLIEDGNEELALRYIEHNAVDLKRYADEYDKSQTALGGALLGKRQRGSIDKEHAKVEKKYGSSFCKPYGWYAGKRKGRIDFQYLQEEAGRKTMNPSYKIASFNVHADARSLFFRLTDIGYDLPIAGKSNSGLVEPGQNAAFTFTQITGLTLGVASNADRMMEMNVLIAMRDAIPKALERAQRKLERDEVEFQRGQLIDRTGKVKKVKK